MKKLDFVELADGKTLDEAIEILKRLRRKHPDAKLKAQYEEDATMLYVEYPRVRKHRPRPYVKPRELTPHEKMLQDMEEAMLFGSVYIGGEPGIVWWIERARRFSG